MQRLEVSGAVRLIYRSLGVKGLKQAGSITKETERQECNNSQKNSLKFRSSDVEFTPKEKGKIKLNSKLFENKHTVLWAPSKRFSSMH